MAFTRKVLLQWCHFCLWGVLGLCRTGVSLQFFVVSSLLFMLMLSKYIVQFLIWSSDCSNLCWSDGKIFQVFWEKSGLIHELGSLIILPFLFLFLFLASLSIWMLELSFTFVNFCRSFTWTFHSVFLVILKFFMMQC